MKLPEGTEISTGYDSEITLHFLPDANVIIKSLTQAKVEKLLAKAVTEMVFLVSSGRGSTVVQRGDAVYGNARRSLRENHTPAPRSIRRAKKTNEVGNLMEVNRSRERAVASVPLCALGRRRLSQLATQSTKRARVLGA
jgi:hypothetical protein